MSARPVKRAAALLLTSALGLGALRIGTEFATKQAVRQLLARHLGVIAEDIEVDPFTGRVTLRGVQAVAGPTRIAIGVLGIRTSDANGFSLMSSAMASPFDDKPDAEPAPAAPAEPTAPKAAPAAQAAPPVAATPAGTPGSAFAENVVMTNEKNKVSIKRIDMTGTTLSNADLAALFEIKGIPALEAKLRTLSATAVVAPEIVIDNTEIGNDSHTTLNDVLLAGLKNGRATAGSVSKVAFSSKKTGTDESAGSTGPIQSTGVDLAHVLHVLGTVRTSDGEPILPLYDNVVIDTIKLDNITKKSSVTLASLKETGVKARALKADFFAAPPPGATDEQRKKASNDAFDDFSRSVEIGSIEATDFVAKDTVAKDTVAKDMGVVAGTDSRTGGFSRFALHGIQKGQVGDIGLRDLHIDLPQQKIVIGTMDVGAFAIPLSGDGAGITGGKSFVPPSKVDISQVNIDVTPQDGKGSPVKFKLSHAGLTARGTPGEIPNDSTLTIENLAFDVPADSETAKPLYDMGYRHLDLTAGLTTKYDPTTQDLSIHDLSVNGVSMGSAALGLHILNVGRGVISSSADVSKASMLAILIKGLELNVTNDGLFEKAIAWKAGEDGMTVAQERDQGVDFFSAKLPVAFGNGPGIKALGSAVAEFIASPKTLHVKATAKEALGAADLGLISSPDALLDRLDIEANANK